MTIAVRTIVQPVRRCGRRKEGGMYLTTMEGSPDGCLPATSEVDSPIPVNRKPHRGPLVVDGDLILGRQPEEDWYVGSSADTIQKKKADQVWLEMFGMTPAKRLETGDCTGLKSTDEAYGLLLTKVQWSNRLATHLRNLTIVGVSEISNCALPFTQLVRNMQNAATTMEAADLVKVTASIWSLADAAPPKQREKVTRDLASMLACMGLQKDARDLLLRYK